jgi:hypothetical protein
MPFSRLAVDKPFRRIGVLRPASAAVLAISAVLAVFLALRGGFTFFGDSYTYFLYADLVAHGKLEPYLYVRTAGYPALLILSGYTLSHSVVGILALQAVFAVLMPWLVYATFAQFDISMGVAAAAVCLCSLTSFFFQNTLYPDGTYLFFVFAALYFLGRSIVAGKQGGVYLCFACLGCACFLRPAGVALVAAFAVLVLILYRRWIPQLVVSLVALALVGGGFNYFERVSLGGATLRGMSGRQLFLNAYLRSADSGGFLVKGHTFESLERDLRSFFSSDPARSDPPSWGHELPPETAYDLYGQYRNDPPAIVARMFREPEFLYYWALYSFGDRNAGGDREFQILWLRYLQEHPLIVGRYVLENFTDLAVGQSWTYGPGVYPKNREIQSSEFWPIVQNVSNGGPMPTATMKFLDARGAAGGAPAVILSRFWLIDYAARPVFLALMIAGWLAALRESRELFHAMTVVLVAYLANTLLLSLLVDPEFRYQIEGMALSTFSAGAGAYVVVRQIARSAPSTRPQR